MDLETIMSMLKKSPIFWSRLGFVLDPVSLDDDFKPVLLHDDIEYLSYTHDQMYDNNIRIFATNMTSGWIGDGKYDYALVDEMLDKILGNKSDVYYIPIVRLNVPLDWCKAHPEDVFVYEDGPREPDKIEALVGTEKQDFYGYDGLRGYPIAGPTKNFNNRINKNGVIGLQSYTSARWVDDAARALEGLVRHIENGKYRDQVIGYQIAFGTFGENVWWGGFVGHNIGVDNNKNRRIGDYGTNAQRSFYRWGLRKYKSEDALRASWGESIEQTDCVPSVAHRLDCTDDIKSFFRGYPEDRICIDYEEFLSDVLTDAICHFAATVKGIVPEKAVGTFYGYIVGIGSASYCGHTMADKLLASEHIDFLCAPESYYNAHLTGVGFEQAPAQSFARKKLWINVFDNHSHKTDWSDFRATVNITETKKVLWREYAKSFTYHHGFLWMDIPVGNFDDPEILKEISAICRFNWKMCVTPRHKFRREVLLVIDDKVMRHMRMSCGISNFMIKETASSVKMCGVPVDMYRLSDLAEIDLSSYKVAIFLNTFEVDDRTKDIIQNKFMKKTLFIWNYCAGIINGDVDFSNTEDLTGFELAPITLGEAEYKKYVGEMNLDFPTVSIKNSCTSWRNYENGECMIGERFYKGRINIMCTLPYLTVDDFYKIIEQKVDTVYAPKYSCVYANSRIIGVFSGGKTSGKVRLSKRARDVINSNLLLQGNIDIVMEEKDFAIYLKLY